MNNLNCDKNFVTYLIKALPCIIVAQLMSATTAICLIRKARLVVTGLLSTLLIVCTSQISYADSSHEQKELEMESYIAKLDKVNYLPNLLPIIFENIEFIGLTEDQVTSLDNWRKTYREPMLTAMQDITKKRIELKTAALSPNISSARLLQLQNDIFRLHREVLEYKLSCREHVVHTFNNENWMSFYMVLAEENIGAPVPVNLAEN